VHALLKSPQALGSQITSLAKELALSTQEVTALLASVPPILSVSQPTITKDRCGESVCVCTQSSDQKSAVANLKIAASYYSVTGWQT